MKRLAAIALIALMALPSLAACTLSIGITNSPPAPNGAPPGQER